MNIWKEFPAERIRPDDFWALIEISKGAKTKYELDKQTGCLMLDRVLYTSTHYPANYGLIPLTFADDGDPLDVLVLCSESIQPMALVHCYPIGLITMVDGDAQDHKIVAIPFEDPTYNDYQDIHDLPRHIYEEMSHFFSIYKSLEHKETTINEVGSRQDALRVIAECIARFGKM